MSSINNNKGAHAMRATFIRRRIVAVIVAVLAIIGTVKVVSFIGDFLSEDFSCKQQVEITAVSGDTVSELVSGQVQNGNCVGYESLLYYVTDEHGADLQIGDKFIIPVKKGK